MSKKININKKDLVIDLGSNDGTLLQYFKKNSKCKVLGIDPSKLPSIAARKKNINTLNVFFNYKESKLIKKKYDTPKLITSHNTFAHVDNLNDFFKGIDNISTNKTLIVIEIGYWLEVVKNNWFDTIYHEHHDYHSLMPLVKFFKKFQYNIIDYKITKPQGGSLMVFLKKNIKFKIYKKIEKQIALEKKYGLYNVMKYKEISNKLQKIRNSILKTIYQYKKNNKLICAFGSPTKSVTLLSFLKLKKNTIKYIYEDNNLKCNLFNPYENIPIVSSKLIKKHQPDIIIILSWNFAKLIIKNTKKKLKKDIIFIVPLPRPYIVK